MLVSELITQVRSLADMEKGGFISDNEVLAFVNQSLNDVYTQVIRANEGYYVTTAPLVNNNLPDNCFKLVGILMNNSNIFEPCWAKRVGIMDLKSAYNTYNFDSHKYSIVANKIVWSTSVQDNAPECTLYFIPYPTKLTLASTLEEPLIMLSNAIIYSCVVKCLAKEESDFRLYKQMADEELAKVLYIVSNRDESAGQVVRDVYGNDSY
jgi:hypothetical protein